jgi:hypothetical protein
LLKNSWSAEQAPSAAKAVAENKPVIAAVNRCATQKLEQNRVFQQSVQALRPQMEFHLGCYRRLPAVSFGSPSVCRSPA